MAGGACMVGGVHGGACPPRQIMQLQHTVNEWAVSILLECILVYTARKGHSKLNMLFIFREVNIKSIIFSHSTG